MSEEKKTYSLEELKNMYEKEGKWASVEWTDLVLSHLADNEVSKDNNGKLYPRVRGLRRIGSYITGYYILCDVICAERSYAACLASAYSPSGVTSFSSMAEATPENVNNEMIAKHLLATAESRAEGRCWTKVLMLNCLTAEEMSLSSSEQPTTKESVKDIDQETNEEIAPIQKKLINKKCKELDVNLEKIAENTCNKSNLDVKLHYNNGKISTVLAAKILERLDKSIREQIPIPDEFKGYTAK